MENNKGIKLINVDQIVSIKFQPNKEYEFYRLVRKGDVIKKFFGLYKKIVEKDTYYVTDFWGFFKEERYEEVKDISKWIKENNDSLRLDENSGKIFYKPKFLITYITGKTQKCFAETLEEAEDFLKEFNEKPNFIKIDL